MGNAKPAIVEKCMYAVCVYVYVCVCLCVLRLEILLKSNLRRMLAVLKGLQNIYMSFQTQCSSVYDDYAFSLSLPHS